MRRVTEKDRQYMKKALGLASKAKGKTFPNPAVGAVIVKDDIVVATGATAICGGPHAEKEALKKAKGQAQGATLYVTLEPCCHYGRTPPCTTAIIDAGIKRVVVAITDPNPLVAGKGIRALRRKGITVVTGVLKKNAFEINEDFFWSIIHTMSWVSVKIAMTLDGRIADHEGSSKWITGKQSRTIVHELRRRHAAIAVGAATLRSDNPRLDVRHVHGQSPTRIAFAGSPDRIPVDSHFVQNAHQKRSIIVCPEGRRGKQVLANNVELWHTGETRQSVQHIEAFLQMTFHEGLTSIFVEGGQKLIASFISARRVNRMYIFYGNHVLGGGHDGLRWQNPLSLRDSIHLEKMETVALKDNVMITGIAVWS
ncbi:MAG: bifunctional diaminohydroxyphosphoribosylaminopyrimidine deaminase/5-amino-6-(5-phosphoribosylamino)uracil reductase RibD [Fibrobacterota bacterium]